VLLESRLRFSLYGVATIARYTPLGIEGCFNGNQLGCRLRNTLLSEVAGLDMFRSLFRRDT
jgi:hypothetical protein